MSGPFSLFVPCGIIAVASVPLMLKLVPPNGLYGFRTRQTLADAETWYRANRFAGWALFIAAALSALVFVARPEYATGRDIAGVVVLLLPMAAAVASSLAYARRIGRDPAD